MNGQSHFLRFIFSALLVCLSPTAILAQARVPITNFDVVGNVDAHLMPGEVMRIVASASAVGNGVLQLKLRGASPDFLTGWDEVQVECETGCQIEDTLLVRPSSADYGRYSFNIFAEFLSDNVQIDAKSRRIELAVAPRLKPEPPFTAGSSNELCWEPFESRFEYELIKQLIARRQSGNSAYREPVKSFLFPEACDVAENLPEGLTFAYHVVATDARTGLKLKSNEVFSVQDRTAPPAARIEHFQVDQQGTVSLTWEVGADETSYVDRYVVFRKRVDTTERFVAVDTLSVFPVTRLQPLNYYPVLAREGEPIYVDHADSLFLAGVGKTFEIRELPAELQGATMIKTAISDRWNETEDFMTIELLMSADVFVAFDVDNRNISQPDWLERSYEQTGESVDVGDGRLRLFRNQVTHPKGEVVLGGNFAAGSRIANKEPMMYVIFVKPTNNQLYRNEQWIRYRDELGPDNDRSTFKYKLNTIDAVGNSSEGPESPPIVLDLNGSCRPQIANWFIFESPGGEKYGKGLANEVGGFDPRLDANCVGFRDTDSLRFQAAREVVRFFDDSEGNAGDERFFDSNWIGIQDLPNPYQYRFELLPTDISPDFVNGKRYYYRMRSKDQFGNISAWSDTVSAIQDVFPPDDVSSLSVEPVRFKGGQEGCNFLAWTGANDFVSGVKSFVVFRKELNDLHGYAAIDTIPGTQAFYCDSLSSFTENQIVSYKVGSIDNVGNARNASDTEWEQEVRALLGPQLIFDTSEVLACSTGRTRIVSDSIRVSWPDFDNSDVAGYELELVNPAGSTETRLLFSSEPTSTVFALAGGDGEYRIRMRAFYANRDTTIYSNTIAVRKKVSLANVSNLQARQDIAPTGNIQLSWSHPDADEIEQFEIFTWREGQSRPNQPSFVVPGSVTSWAHDVQEHNLVTYSCNYYAVRARDCFGLASDTDVVVSSYSAKPPVFLKEQTVVGRESIKVCWERPFPRAKADDSFESIMLVYQDSLSSQPLDSLSFINDTCYVFYNPLPQHNYIFKVKEVVLSDLEQSCSDRFESSFSRPLTVPFENEPSVVEFDAQALPILPDSSTGQVFLSWQNFSDPAVTHFVLNYRSLTVGAATQDSFIVVADTFLVRGLDRNQRYEFKLTSVDSLGQRSREMRTEEIHFSPSWVYTPKIVDVSPRCLRDSVEVVWDWVDDNLVSLWDRAGADSVFIELSIDPNFVLKKSIKALPAVRAFTFHRTKDFPFVNAQNNRLYIRIRAKDKWGHYSPWSSSFPQLGIETGNYDEVPPGIVVAEIDSVKAPLFGRPDQINVYLKWPDATDDCSGTASYQIARGDSVIAVVKPGTNGVNQFVDSNVPVNGMLTSESWRVFAIDSVGNEQAVSVPTTIPLVLTAPDSAGFVNDSTFCWEPSIASLPGFDISYFLEGARFPSLLGNSLTNIIAGPVNSLCYQFQVPWDAIYWRVKARVGNFESAWSDTFFCEFERDDIPTSITNRSMPERFALQQNFPNPFNPSTKIRYDIPASVGGLTPVLLQIFNVKGQEVRKLVDERQRPGEYVVQWDAKNEAGHPVGTGIYVYRIKVEDFTSSYKMSYVK